MEFQNVSQTNEYMEFNKNSAQVLKMMSESINISYMKMLYILFINKQIFQHFHFHECLRVNRFAMENIIENCDFGLEKSWKLGNFTTPKEWQPWIGLINIDMERESGVATSNRVDW